MIYSTYQLPNFPSTTYEKSLFQVVKQGATLEKDAVVVGNVPIKLNSEFQGILNWTENRLCLDFLQLNETIIVNCLEEDIDKAVVIMCRLKIQKYLSSMQEKYESFGFPVFLNFDADKVIPKVYDSDFKTLGMHLVHLTKIGNCPVLMIRIIASLLLSDCFDYALTLIRFMYDVLKHTEQGNDLVQCIVNYVYDRITDKHLFVYQLYKSNFSLEQVAIKNKKFPWNDKLLAYFQSTSFVPLHKAKLILLATNIAFKSKLYTSSIDYALEYCNKNLEIDNATTLLLLFKVACAFFELNRRSESSLLAAQLLPLLDYPTIKSQLFKFILESGPPSNSSIPIINQQVYDAFVNNPLDYLIKTTLLYSNCAVHDNFNIYFSKYLLSNNKITINHIHLANLQFHLKPTFLTPGTQSLKLLILCNSHLMLKFDKISILAFEALNVTIQGPCHLVVTLTGLASKGNHDISHISCVIQNSTLNFDCFAQVTVQHPLKPSPIALFFDQIPLFELFSIPLDQPLNVESIKHDFDHFQINDSSIEFIPIHNNHSFSIVHDEYLLEHVFTAVLALDCTISFKFRGDALFLLEFKNNSNHDLDIKAEQQLIPLMVHSLETGIMPCLFEEIPSYLEYYWKSCGNLNYIAQKIPIMIKSELHTFINSPGMVKVGEIFEIEYWALNMMGSSTGPLVFQFDGLLLVSGNRQFQEEIKSKKLKCWRYKALIERSGRYELPLINSIFKQQSIDAIN